jgi:Resolvase, N terminal domain
MGCDVVKVYRDHGISGAKGRDKRPAFDVALLSDLHALGIDLFLHQQGLDTTTPAGKAMFQMMGVFAEFERAMIQERVRAGLARAKSEGKRLGRLAPSWKSGSGRLWRLQAGPACARSRSGFGVDPGTVQGLVALALSWTAPQASSCIRRVRRAPSECNGE